MHVYKREDKNLLQHFYGISLSTSLVDTNLLSGRLSGQAFPSRLLKW